MTRDLSLNGTWDLTWASGQRGRLEYETGGKPIRSRYLAARVPGEVHDDLIRQGLIPDPYVQGQVLQSRWVEEMLWSYRREFTAPAEARKKSARAWLVFEGLDLVANIHLNGVKIGEHRNTFYPCRVEVTGKLKSGTNVLRVDLDSGVIDAGDKPAAGYSTSPDAKLHKRHWLRKPQCQAEWDWSPRMLNVGIFKPVRLEWTVDAVRADQFVPLAEVADDLNTGKLRARWFVEGLKKTAVKGVLRVTLTPPDGGAPVKVSAAVEFKPGLHPVEAQLEIANPKLWWPIGHGAQSRYGIKAELVVSGRVVATESCKVGFRKVRVNQEPHPELGRWYIIEINNRPIFLKGGNLVPADLITARLDKQRYEGLVARALESNMNALRVWGGGLYESSDLYDLCDEKGILVWQEFIYACAKYPVIDKAFHDDIKKEAVFQIRRLARYPSLIVWCGNNEMEEGNWHWGYDRQLPFPDYALFHLVLPRLMKAEDPTRFYQPSSPFSLDHLDPNRPETGDQHPWSVGFHNTDFRDYRKMIHRFPNEGGILGPTALKTVTECLPEGTKTLDDGPTKAALAWETHENSISHWAAVRPPDLMLEQWLGKKRPRMTIADWVFWGGIVQGEGLSEYIKNFRRRMFHSSSAIFWMYNDTWPAVRSWTTVDFRLRRTPSFHPVRRAFAPVIVVVAREEDTVKVFGVNETQRKIRGDLRYGVMKFAGTYPVDETKPVTLEPNASTLLATFDGKAWDKLDVKTTAAFALLTDGAGTELSRDRLFLPYFKQLNWPKPSVKMTLKNGNAIFTSSKFAWRVCLDLDGEQPYADNFFDVWPGIPTVLPWPKSLGRPKILRIGNR